MDSQTYGVSDIWKISPAQTADSRLATHIFLSSTLHHCTIIAGWRVVLGAVVQMLQVAMMQAVS